MIKILKRYCNNCQTKLKSNTTWYFSKDKVYCSRLCRSYYLK